MKQRLELAAIAVALIALTLLIVQAVDGGILFTRPLWVDEWYTVLVAGERSPAGVIGHLRHGADGGAGLFHLIVWGVYSLTGSLTPVTLRVLSLVMVWAAVWIVYVVLRRRFTPDASVVGALALASQALVVAHQFDGRFYGLWMLTAALCAWTVPPAHGSSRARRVAFAAASVLLVASHWYGVFSLGVMCAAVVVSGGSRWRESLRALSPAIAGLIAGAVISPLALGQRSAVTVDSWIPEFTLGQLRAVVATFWTSRVPVVALIIIAAAWLLARGGKISAERWTAARDTVRDPGIVALISLAAMPLVITALSIAGQPSMIARYAIPATLAWAPAAAFAVTLLGKWAGRVAAVALVGLWFVNLAREAGRQRAFAEQVAQERVTFTDATRQGLPIVFQSQHTMYPATAADRGRGAGVPTLLLELPDSTFEALFPRGSRWYQLNKGFRLERDFARVHAARFGYPVLAPQATLDTTPRFLVVATDARQPRGAQDLTAFARATFPRHRVTRLSERLLLLERPARSLPERSTSR